MSSAYPNSDQPHGYNSHIENMKTSSTGPEMQRFYAGQQNGERHQWDPANAATAGYNSNGISDAVRRQYMQQYNSQMQASQQASQPAFNMQGSQPAFNTQQQSQPAFNTREPNPNSQPAFNTHPAFGSQASQPAFNSHPSQPAFSTQPSQPAFPMNSLWSPATAASEIQQQRLQQSQRLHPTHELILQQQHQYQQEQLQQLQQLQQQQAHPQHTQPPGQYQNQFNSATSEYNPLQQQMQWNNVYNSQSLASNNNYSKAEKKPKQPARPPPQEQKRQDKRSNESSPANVTVPQAPAQPQQEQPGSAEEGAMAGAYYRHPHTLPMGQHPDGGHFPSNVLAHNGFNYTMYPNPVPRISTMYPFNVPNETAPLNEEQIRIPDALSRRSTPQNGAPVPTIDPATVQPITTAQSREAEAAQIYQRQARHSSSGQSPVDNPAHPFFHQRQQQMSGSPHNSSSVDQPRPTLVTEPPKSKLHDQAYMTQEHYNMAQQQNPQDKKKCPVSPKPPLPYSTISIRNCTRNKEHRSRSNSDVSRTKEEASMPSLDHSPKPAQSSEQYPHKTTHPSQQQQDPSVTNPSAMDQSAKVQMMMMQQAQQAQMMAQQQGHPRMPLLYPMPVLKPRPDLKEAKLVEDTKIEVAKDEEEEGTGTISNYLNPSETTENPYMKLWSDINDDDVDSHDLTIEIDTPAQNKEEGAPAEGFDETTLPDLCIETEPKMEEVPAVEAANDDVRDVEVKQSTAIPVITAPTNEVPQREVPQREVPQHEVLQHEVPHHEVPQLEVPQHEVPQREVPQHEVPQHERSMSGDDALLQLANIVDQLQPIVEQASLDLEELPVEVPSEDHIDLLLTAKEKINREESEDEGMPSPPPATVEPEPELTEDVSELPEEDHPILEDSNSEEEHEDITKSVEIVLGIHNALPKGSGSADDMEVAVQQVQQKPMLSAPPQYSNCNSIDEPAPTASSTPPSNLQHSSIQHSNTSAEVTRYINVKDLVEMPVPNYSKSPSPMNGVEEPTQSSVIVRKDSESSPFIESHSSRKESESSHKESECSNTTIEMVDTPPVATSPAAVVAMTSPSVSPKTDGAVSNSSDVEDFHSDSSSQAGDTGDVKKVWGRRKRQKHNVSETEVLIPLSQGWERHTRIKRGLGASGSLRGEVLYIAPCSKKLRTYNDLQKYLTNNDIDNVSIDQFSFSNSMMVGQYFEQDLKTGQYVSMPDEALQGRILEALQRKSGKSEVKEQMKQIQQDAVRRKVEEMAQISSDSRLLVSTNSEGRREQESDNDKEKENMSRIAVITSTKVQSPTSSVLHEKYSSPKIPVVTSNKSSSGAYDNLLRVEQQQELQKQLIQLQAQYTQSIEQREKKEALQYAEQLQQEELRLQRAAQQAQARREQRDYDMQVMTLLKRPSEDLTLTDSKDYPELSRFENCGVNADTFADVLMIVEFLHAFGEVLKITEIPTVNKLQCCLLNTQSEEDRLFFNSLLSQLLPLAMKDPGFPSSKIPKNAIGQTLTAIHLTEYTLTEVARLYLIATGWTNESALITMQTEPVWSLQPSYKAALLAHMVNELLSNSNVVSKLEENMGEIDTLRKEKWNIECQIRKIRLLEGHARQDMEGIEETISNQSKLKDEESEGEEMDMSVPISTESMTTEELEKYYHKLTKKHGQMSVEIVKCGSALRTLPLGQDRYRRQYWLLGHAGGIYVEGINRKRRFIELELDKKTYNPPSEEELAMLALYAEQRQAGADLRTERGPEQRAAEYSAATTSSQDMYNQRPRRGRPPKQRNSAMDNLRVEQLLQHQQAQQLESLLRNASADDLQKMLGTNTTAQQPWFNLLPRQPCATATTKLSDLKAHLEAAERERSMSQIQNALQGQNGQMAQLMQLLAGGGQMSPELLLMHPQLLQQLLGGQGGSNTQMLAALQQQLGGGDSGMAQLLLQQQATQLLLAQQQELALRQAGIHPVLAAHYTQQLLQQQQQEATKDSELKQQQLMIQQLLGGAGATESDKKESAELEQSVAALQQLHILAQLSGGSEDVMKQLQALTQAGLSVNDLIALQQIEQSSKPNEAQHVKPEQQDLALREEVKEEQKETPQLKTEDSPPSTSSSTAITDTKDVGNNFGISASTPPPSELLREETLTPALPNLPDEASSQEEVEEAKEEVEESKDILHLSKIPEDFTKGWWRITSQSTIRQILLAFNSRGVRERNLQKQFHKCLNDAKDALKTMPNNKDPKVPGCPYSSHVKKRKSSSERKNSSEECSSLILPYSEGDNAACPTAQLDLVRNVYRQLEEFKEKVLRGSLQMRDCKLQFNSLSPNANEDVSLSFTTHSEAMIACKELLSKIESSIELRYLKPPLKTHQPILVPIKNSEEQSGGESEREEVDKLEERSEVRIAPGLRTWRTAVTAAENPSQLSICVEQLSASIAWDKSIMKVYCQVCCKGGADHLLLLCDGCDRGFHTYCCSPALQDIPDSDWFCNKCVARNTPDDMCNVCSLKGGRQISCTKCLRNFHHTCLQPPMYKVARGDWMCSDCNKSGASKESVSPKAAPVSSGRGRGRGGRGRKTEETRQRRPSTYNLPTCLTLLDELRTHHCAWPFLSPVDRQQFPEYYKYIKHPMDFTTISQKLTNNKYLTNEDMYKDIKLIFNNCHKFNEDESEVGQAGLTMRCYFEKRYAEVFK